jgi:hypothetical protein
VIFPFKPNIKEETETRRKEAKKLRWLVEGEMESIINYNEKCLASWLFLQCSLAYNENRFAFALLMYDLIQELHERK